MRKYSPDTQSVEYPDGRRVWREGNLVYKVDPNRLGDEWQKKFSGILDYYCPELLYDVIENGYVTRYVDGIDLHGNKPFDLDGSVQTCGLPPYGRLGVLKIFELARRAGGFLGYTFGDITCGNILFDGTKFYLIDYEVITEYPLSQAYTHIWTNTLRIVFGG